MKKKLLSKLFLSIGTLVATNSFSQAPVANFSINPNPVCSGVSNVVSITDMSTNAPTAWSYSFQAGTPPNSSVKNPTVTYLAGGIYTIAMVCSNSSGTSTPVVKTITVNASPNLFINPNNQFMCFGAGPLTFFANSSVGTYTWNTGANTNTISVSPAVTTVYTCVTTSTVNGCTTSRTATANVNPLPVVTITSNPSALCGGGSATLTASGTGGGPYTYSWSTGVTTQSTFTNTAGVYTAVVTNSNNCKGTGSFTLGTSASLTVTAISTPTTKCATVNATLQAFGATNYTWSSGATTSLTVVNPTITTSYTVFGTSGTCTGVAVVNLSVVPNPTIVTTSSSPSVCSGKTATLSASGAITYTWFPGAIVGANIVVTPTTVTSYTAVGNNGYCNAFTAISIGVNPNPTITVTSAPAGYTLCAGSSITVTTSGALTYTWIPGNLSGSVNVISPTVTTSYSIMGTNAAGCTSTVGGPVTVYNPTVTAISNPGSLCTGLTATLTSGGAISYTWSTGSNSSSIAVTPTTTTTYTVFGKDVNGCINSAMVTVTVGGTPVVNVVSSPTMLCVGQTATLTASGTTSYTWDSGATTAIIVVTPTTNTTYTVLGSNGGTCSNVAVFTLSVSACTGVQSLTKQTNEIKVYPNPNSGQFTLSLSTAPVNTEAYIYNAIGQLIYKEKLITIDTVINTSQFSKGIYILRITENNTVIKNEKIIKE